MKKFLAITTAALAALTAFAAGCGANSKNYASLSSNWYTYHDNKKIQPAFTEGNENFRPEKMTYTVSQSMPSDNGAYAVEYSAGVYTTEFYAKRIYADELAKITAENRRSEYFEKMGGAAEDGDKFIVLYCYKTELSIPSVTYKFGEEEKTFENEYRRTLSYFMSVEDYLSPVYSKQEIKNAAPASAAPEKPKTLEECYELCDRVYESFYSFSGSEVVTEIHDNISGGDLAPLGASGLDRSNYSVFDGAYLDVVVRGMKGMSAGSGQTVTVYTPATKAAEYYISCSDAALSADAERNGAQLSGIKDVLSRNNLLSADDAETLSTVACNVVYNAEVFTGFSQSYWFANADDGKGKRTVMIKYSCPLAYNAGQIEYLLSDITSLPEV